MQFQFLLVGCSCITCSGLFCSLVAFLGEAGNEM